jgi:hypothetical protein
MMKDGQSTQNDLSSCILQSKMHVPLLASAKIMKGVDWPWGNPLGLVH